MDGGWSRKRVVDAWSTKWIVDKTGKTYDDRQARRRRDWDDNLTE